MSKSKLNRRDVFRISGGVAGVAAMSAVASAVQASQQHSPANQEAEAMAHPQARFAYVGSTTRVGPGGASAVAVANPPEGITVYTVGPGMGDLSQIQSVPSDNPNFLAIHPSEDYLYAVNAIADYDGGEQGAVQAYAIDDEIGELTLINTVACAKNPAHLVVSPGGDYLVIATYVGATYEIFPINEDGSLGEASHVALQEGSGPHDRQAAPHPHGLAFDPGGNYVVGADLGTDLLQSFEYGDGELVEVGSAMVAPGSGPRHVAFHPNGEIIYVINEMAGTITSFAFDPATGEPGDELQTIATVPQDFRGQKSTAEILVHPSGKFLYGSNRRYEDHPLADSIVAYTIDDQGMLSLIGYTTHGVNFPRAISIDPTGKWLYSMGKKDDSVVQFYIDPNSGALIPTGFTTVAMVPVTMTFKS